jgi:hypothetical protein
MSASIRYQVTFAARSCPSYAQVMGNRVRDDSVEAATAPGKASTYTDGQPVDPTVEAASACTPLNGWRFTLGGGQQKTAALSTVTGATVEVGPAGSDVPLLDAAGKPTGKTIAGAVTAVLTGEQVRLALGRQLWVQGGTPADPLLAKSFPGYGFGALRCGFDGRSGTNAQWVGFPAGVRHVFCFAYYVRGAPPAGTLIVRAKATRPVGYPQRFTFDASPSYTADKQIVLASAGEPADAALTRTAGGAGNRIVARVPAGWRVTDLTCTRSGAGKSTVSADRATATAQVTLAAGEIVTCSYAFEPPATTPGLSVRVYSDLAGATFGVSVNGDGGPRSLQAAPAGDGSAVLATGADLSALNPGQYTVTLSPPGAESSLWSLAGVTCNGADVKPDGLVTTITVEAQKPIECALRVARKPASLDLRVVTVGDVGTASFAVVPTAGGPGWSGTATTTGFGVPAAAQGDVPAALPYGSYLVTPLPPKSTVEGSWRLSSFACDPGDRVGGEDTGTTVIPLALNAADAKCVATFQLVPATRLGVALRFSGETSGRDGPAVLSVTCTDGSIGRVVLPANDFTERSLPLPLAFLDATQCTVDRPADGAASAVATSVSATLDPAPGNAPLSLPGRVEIKRDVTEYQVTVTISYTATDEGPRQATVLDTFRVLPVALIGAGLVGIGLVILLVMVVRSRAV